MHFGIRGPQIIYLCAGICNLVDGLRGLLRFKSRSRGCGVCIGRTLSLERVMHLSKGHLNNQRYVSENRAQTLRSSLRRSDCAVDSLVNRPEARDSTGFARPENIVRTFTPSVLTSI